MSNIHTSQSSWRNGKEAKVTEDIPRPFVCKKPGDTCRLHLSALYGCEKHDLKNHGEQSAYLIVQFTVLPKEKSGQELKAGHGGRH